MLGHRGAARISLQLHWDKPEKPAADALQGFLGLPVHGSQDLVESPEQQHPQAQELKHEAVVVSIVPHMVASSLQEFLYPPKQALGQVEQASCQPERPAEYLPKEGGGDTWGAAFWRADGRYGTRAFRWNISPRCFLFLPCPFLLSLLIQLCPSLPLFAAGFTVNKMGLAVKFAFVTVEGIGSQAQGGSADTASEALSVEKVALGTQPLHHVHTLLTKAARVLATQAQGERCLSQGFLFQG